MNFVEFNALVGKTLNEIRVNKSKSEVVFTCADGTRYHMAHIQDCCERVSLIDTDGDLQDLIGEEILVAEERTNAIDPPMDEDDESYTWTFYTIRTNKASVTMRWYGVSNGYYSETVDFFRLKKGDKY